MDKLGISSRLDSRNRGLRKKASSYNPSSQCISLMTQYETFKGMPYDDQTGKEISSFFDSQGRTIKGATIGYGHLIKNESEFEKYRKGISRASAMKLFSDDLSEYIFYVQRYVHSDITQSEFDAIIMLAFNIGAGSPKSVVHQGLYYSTVLKIINKDIEGDLDRAWMLYSHSQGKTMKGLLNRRRSELNVFHKGVYIKL